MAKKIEDLGSWDWDDSALIRAYERGMTLNVKDCIHKYRKGEKKDAAKTDEWKVGDYCRAIYSGDGLMYEAKVISLHDDYCTVEYLGYDEVAEVDYESMEKSQGKKAQKKQILSASSNNENINNANEYVSGSGDDVGSEIATHQSSRRHHSPKKHHHKKHRKQMLNQQADYTAASVTVDSIYPFHQHMASAPVMHPLPPPPAPECSEIASNPSLRAMLTSWYMAGYYTGLHQSEKRQLRQCQASHNYYHS